MSSSRSWLALKNRKDAAMAELATRELSRRHLLDFTKYTMPKYDENWHHKIYASKLDSFLDGKIKNLMVFMPPQHGKSELSTRRLPSMKLGRNPDAKLAVIAYNHTIAAKFNRDVQRIIDSPEYGNLFPGTRLNQANIRTVTGQYLRNADEFEIVGHSGSLVSTGVGGSLTSRTVDMLIMDDLYKDAQDAWSQTIRDNVLDWYLTVANTRLHNDSQRLLVFTRWHEDDLAGYLLENEPGDWEVVVFEAIKTDRISTPGDPRTNGEPLWPQKHKLEKLEKIRKQNNIVFESLYQQNPKPKEGLLFVDLNEFSLDELKGDPDGVVCYVDTADKGTDYLAAPSGLIYGDKIYINDVVFTQEPVEVTEPAVADLLIRNGTDRCTIESNSGGRQFARNVRRIIEPLAKTTIIDKPTTQNKETRILMKSGFVKENFYFRNDYPRDGDYAKFMRQLKSYAKAGKNAHDDAADAITGLAETIDKKPTFRFV